MRSKTSRNRDLSAIEPLPMFRKWLEKNQCYSGRKQGEYLTKPLVTLRKRILWGQPMNDLARHFSLGTKDARRNEDKKSRANGTTENLDEHESSNTSIEKIATRPGLNQDTYSLIIFGISEKNISTRLWCIEIHFPRTSCQSVQYTTSCAVYLCLETKEASLFWSAPIISSIFSPPL